jgi:hypothetical protein
MARIGGNIRIDEAGIQELMLDPGGPVALMLEDLATRAAGVARGTVRVDTGRTLGSIRTGSHHGPVYQSTEVSAKFAVFFLEKGVKPHLIFARGLDYSLRADIPRPGGEGYMGPAVIHPGFPPKPFLTTALWSLQNNV